ncbi:glycerol dehydrogenase [Streptococcus suis]|uniref:glycerol dehydrogenase n=1 Tax=Streptococcus suis TaxID=1307 RepID=UPI00209A758D|nr:glycerol dehydrogenase [Streptococcus suis]MCO8214365.1 glycerol dehydrogenase [Streptococcus suis]HEM3439376.1 glycerol dehydrogenase [Streptococcus suis]
MKQFSGLSCTIQGNHLLDTCAIDILKIGHRPLVLCAKQEYNTTVEKFVKVLTCHGLIVKITYMEEWDQNLVEECGEVGFRHCADHIIGIGNSSVAACTKSVADLLDLPAVLIPTSPFTTLPRLSVENMKRERPLFNESIQLIIADRDQLLTQPTTELMNGVVNTLLYLAAIKEVKRNHLFSLIDDILIRGFESVLFNNSLQAIEDFEARILSNEVQDVLEVLSTCVTLDLPSDAWDVIQQIESKLSERREDLVDEPLKRNLVLYLLLIYLTQESEEFQARLKWCQQLLLSANSSNLSSLEAVFKEIALEMVEDCSTRC